MEQKPSLGRIVHYFGDLYEGEPVMYAAIITAVRESGNVDLYVFGKNALYPEENIPLGNSLRTWNWPPRV